MPDSDSTFDLFVEIVDQIGRDNVRLCPDVGAMGLAIGGTDSSGSRRWLLTSTSSPFVYDGPETLCRIDEYAPEVHASSRTAVTRAR